jgi:hypothetical protein
MLNRGFEDHHLERDYEQGNYGRKLRKLRKFKENFAVEPNETVSWALAFFTNTCYLYGNSSHDKPAANSFIL